MKERLQHNRYNKWYWISVVDEIISQSFLTCSKEWSKDNFLTVKSERALISFTLWIRSSSWRRREKYSDSKFGCRSDQIIEWNDHEMNYLSITINILSSLFIRSLIHFMIIHYCDDVLSVSQIWIRTDIISFQSRTSGGMSSTLPFRISLRAGDARFNNSGSFRSIRWRYSRICWLLNWQDPDNAIL